MQSKSPEQGESLPTPPQNTSTLHNASSRMLLEAFNNDHALEVSGGSGKFQKCMVPFISLSFSLTGFFLFGIPYLQESPTLICRGFWGREYLCTVQEVCSNEHMHYRYDSDVSISNLITDYGLLCAQKSEIGLIGFFLFIGIIIGSLIFPRAADLMGRKPVILLGFLLHIVIMMLFLFCQGLKVMLYVCIFLLGFKALMNSQIAYILLLETVSSQKRNQYGSMIITLDSIWQILIVAYYYVFMDWKPLLLLVVFLTLLLFIVFWKFMPQSPKYYTSIGEIEKAKQVYMRISIINTGSHNYEYFNNLQSKKTSEVFQTSNPPIMGQKIFNFASNSAITESPKFEEKKITTEMELQEDPKSTQLKIAKQIPPIGSIRVTSQSRTSLTLLLLLLGFNWFAGTCVYYGFTFTLRFLKGDLFIFGMAIGAAQTLGDICSFLLAQLFGRKQTLSFAYILSAFALIAHYFYSQITDDELILVVTLVVAKFGNAAAFNLLYILTSEEVPTNLRGTAFGLTSCLGRFGGIASSMLAVYLEQKTLIFMSSMSFLASGLSLCLLLYNRRINTQ